MITVNISIDIKHPAKETFAFISNPENNPVWQKGMEKCTITSQGEFGVGSEYEQEATFRGKPVLTTFKIVEYEKDHFIKGDSIVSTFPITFKRIVEGDDSISHVKAIITGEPGGFMKMVPFFTRWMIKGMISKDYKALKKLLESNPN